MFFPFLPLSLSLSLFLPAFQFNLWQQEQSELPFNPTPAALIALITAFTMATCPDNQSNPSGGISCILKPTSNSYQFLGKKQKQTLKQKYLMHISDER